MVYDLDDAKDLMSETVTIALEKYDTMRNQDAFKFFVFGIASRLFKKHITRKKNHLDINSNQFYMLESTVPKTDAKADIPYLYKAIEKLPENEREIITLFELSGFSLQEISDLKEMNINTVKTHLSRSRTNLKQILNPNKEIIQD